MTGRAPWDVQKFLPQLLASVIYGISTLHSGYPHQRAGLNKPAVDELIQHRSGPRGLPAPTT